jgi:hypothetical protein
MATAESLAFSIREEMRGVHALLWDDAHDLVRALLVLRAALREIPVYAILMSGEQCFGELQKYINARCPIEETIEGSAIGDVSASSLAFIFIPQASSRQTGSWLNGWRSPLSEPLGAVLFVRHADFDAFQRAAPDLSSFVGPRIHDASTMLSIISDETAANMSTTLPDEWSRILAELPGTAPTDVEIQRWLDAHTKLTGEGGK